MAHIQDSNNSGGLRRRTALCKDYINSRLAPGMIHSPEPSTTNINTLLIMIKAFCLIYHYSASCRVADAAGADAARSTSWCQHHLSRVPLSRCLHRERIHMLFLPARTVCSIEPFFLSVFQPRTVCSIESVRVEPWVLAVLSYNRSNHKRLRGPGYVLRREPYCV